MASRKTASAPPATKVATRPPAERAAPRNNSASMLSEPNRMLREAAWTRMFGRTETKNPFTR